MSLKNPEKLDVMKLSYKRLQVLCKRYGLKAHLKKHELQKNLKLVINSPRRSPPSESSLASSLEAEMACSICQMIFIDAVTLNCSHSFCRFCIEKWTAQSQLDNSHCCPLCRIPITTLCPSAAINNYIQHVLDSLGGQIKEDRDDAITDRKESAPKRSSIANVLNANLRRLHQPRRSRTHVQDQYMDHRRNHPDVCHFPSLHHIRYCARYMRGSIPMFTDAVRDLPGYPQLERGFGFPLNYLPFMDPQMEFYRQDFPFPPRHNH